MPSRISLTLLVCMIGAAAVIGALFLPPREVAAPTPPNQPTIEATKEAPERVEVSIQNFAFTSTPTLAAGQEIVVVNNDSAPHTLTAEDGSFDTGVLQPGEQVVIVLPQDTGRFSYFCALHPSMTGAFDVAS